MGDPRGPGAPVTPLLVACALGIEQVALRSGRGVPGPVRVLRTGMGPRAAEAAVARLLGPGGVPD
ncbi:1-hydroxy-2-methyl-2-butenyl 4-diphosphate reductase, partial [Streptomyces sp. WAC00303]